MTGENQYEQDPDALNEDDFVIEDMRAEDLDELFPTPEEAKAAAKTPAAKAAGAATPAGDPDDVLFEDHTKGLDPSETFAERTQFSEGAKSQWDGDGLDLDEVGVPEAGAELADEAEVGATGAIGAAKAEFEAELGAMLTNEEEFGLDSESELELLEPNDQVPEEFEVSGPFVLDDGDGEWQKDLEPAAAAADDEVAPELELQPLEPHLVEVDEPAEGEPAWSETETVAGHAGAAEDFAPALSASTGDDDHEEGWEPLPTSNVDELAEVDEVGAAPEPQVLQPQLAAVAPEQVEGHDIYAEDEAAAAAAVAVVAPPRRGRLLRMVSTLAALLLLSAAVGLVIARPAWFGLRIEPERLDTVQITRPKVAVVASVPPVPKETASLLATSTTPPPSTTPPAGTGQPPIDPVPPVVQPVQPKPADPVAVVEPPTAGTPEVAPTPTIAPEVAPTPSPTVVTAPTVTPTGRESPWPVAVAKVEPAPAPRNAERLVRFGDDLRVGALGKPTHPQAVDGVLPGARTFAQLHNGNYFVGSVKCADQESVTLRMEHGEITLPMAQIEKLTALGSRDYDELQKATSGFVRLTNNNRLVGGILTRIADDHIVLEFRSNRVMLPRSAVGEVVRDENDAGVRLDTTREEDDWLRQIAERQLGTGQAAPAAETPPQKQ